MSPLAHKKLSLVSLVLLSLVTTSASSQEKTLGRAESALRIPAKGAAYGAYIDIFLISKTHPDRKLQQFIDQSRTGNTDSFAGLAYLTCLGWTGIQANLASCRLALQRAVDEKSASAAIFMGQSFQNRPGDSTQEQFYSYWQAIRWYGVAVGMGEPSGHGYAMGVIDAISQGPGNERAIAMANYNAGLKEGLTRMGKAAQ